MKKTKRLLVLLLVIVTAVSMGPAMSAENVSAAGKVQAIKYSLVPAMKSIKVKWNKPQNRKVSYYVIYRTEFRVKDIYDIEPVPMSDYKKVKKVAGWKSAWKDREVRQGCYYDYVIRGYRKTGGKAKLVCDSYRPGATYYQCPGLQRPDLIDGGYGENYCNSKSKLYLYVQRTDGMTPSGVAIFRKAKGESEYQKINVKDIEKGKFDCGKTYLDDTVRPGETYYYKAKTYVKRFGKKKYSPASNTVKLSALNFEGKYAAKAMTAEGTVKEFSIRLVSDKYNGVLTLQSGAGFEGPVYATIDGGKDYGQQRITLKSYSKDNKNWSAIPSDGLQITAGQTVYLKFRFDSGSGYFSAGSGEESAIDFMYEKTAYAGSAAFGTTETVIKLKEGTASAFPDYDN